MANDLARRGRVRPRQLITRLLDAPELLPAVQHLPAASLARVIESIGLEDAGEIVALASAEQLEALFDEDLWAFEPGQIEERFDSARVAVWLQVLAEAGSAVVAQRLTELPFDFVVLLVHRLAWVIDIEALAVEMSDAGEEAEHLDKALGSCLCEEWEEFRLIARDSAVWDDLLHALLSLDREHHGLLRRILERCVALSADWIEDNGGLFEVLNSDEVLEQDALAARDDRRAEKGFVSFADALAFLQLARDPSTPSGRDPITAAHFRQLERTQPGANAPAQKLDAKTSRHVGRLLRLIDEHDVSPLAPARLGPASNASSEVGTSALLDTALKDLSELDPAVHAQRLQELSYLAHVLFAAAARSQPLRPVEALQAALALTQAGLIALAANEHAAATGLTPSKAATLLRTHSADLLFRHAWRALDSGSVPQSILARLRTQG